MSYKGKCKKKKLQLPLVSVSVSVLAPKHKKKTCTYMCIEAVVSQQSNKVDDLIHVLVVVCFVSDKNPPCIEKQ